MAFNFLSAPMRTMGFGGGSRGNSAQNQQKQQGPFGGRFGQVGQKFGQILGNRMGQQPPANDLPSQGGYGGNFPQQGIGPSQSPWRRFAGQFGGQMPGTGNMYNMPSRGQMQDNTGLGNQMPFNRGGFRNQIQPYQPEFRQPMSNGMAEFGGPMGGARGNLDAMPQAGIGPSFDLTQLTGGNRGFAGGLFNRGFGDYRMM